MANTFIRAEDARKFNDEFPREEQRRILRLMDPHYLHTVSMTELYENVYQSKPPLIDGMLYPGVQLFAGPPKLGKSFFVAQLAELEQKLSSRDSIREQMERGRLKSENDSLRKENQKLRDVLAAHGITFGRKQVDRDRR